MDGKAVKHFASVLVASSIMLTGASTHVAAQKSVASKAETVQTTVSLKVVSVSLREVLKQIAKQAGLSPIYGPAIANNKSSITIAMSLKPRT